MKHTIQEYFKLNKYKLATVTFLLGLFFILQNSYEKFVFEFFYLKHFFNDFSEERYLAMLAIFILLLFLLLFIRTSPFMFFNNVVFTIFLVIPNLILYVYIKNFQTLIVIGVVFFMLIMILLAPIKIKFLQSKQIKLSDNLNILLLTLLSLALLIPFFIKFGFNFNQKVFLLEDIYEIREITKEKMNTIMLYSFSWLSKILLPIIFLLSIKNKQWIFALLSLVCLLYLFAVLAHKTIFFSLFILIFFSFIKSYYRQTLFLTATLFLILVALRLYTNATGNLMPESLLVRRALFLPALINEYYFDFFADKPIYLSHSILSVFFEYPYFDDPAKLIAIKYQNAYTANFNNGFISDGFMNFGAIGVFVFSLLVAAIFNFFNNLKISSYYTGLFFLMIFTMISSYFFTSLFNHGILLTMIISYFILKNTEQND